MIGEPSSDLWRAVRAVYDSWPPDSEDVAAQLATDLGRLRTQAGEGRDGVRRLVRAVNGSWLDAAGDDMAAGLTRNGERWNTVCQLAEHQATLAGRYAQRLADVKTTITAGIAGNDRLYQLLDAVPMLHPVRDRLVDNLAHSFRDLVAEQPTGTANDPTVGLCIGASVSVPGLSFSWTGCVIEAPDGSVGLTSSHAGGLSNTLGVSATAGVGVQLSDGDTVMDQEGPFNNVSVSGGEELGVSVDADWGTGTNGQPVHTGTALVGIGAGASGRIGRSETHVWEIIPGR
ncbi:hypothetical protein Lfu02_02590 [Longispora fulva]|uniref:Outer membrane channel protein CpnT-like N-terminal domain-containing protein n=1 Tax=Longispora fulva TaxID=619741 RepID=A0A8J7GMS9_9ACTN|nr:hypothetical protein [Longispora fulva]MBG6135869.1 hypothetical protein [Longispora fulva]GIG55887.1 hypothetical protein Lfu02_02590 [Longispora fulva]